MLIAILKNAYDTFYFSRLRNSLTLPRSLILILVCLGFLYANHVWSSFANTALSHWIEKGLMVLILLLLLLNLIPHLIGFRKSILNLIPCGQNRWEIHLALLPFLRARSMARLDTNYLELETFTILRYAYAQHLTGTISMASHLFSDRERRTSHAKDIQSYFVGWKANEQENVGQITPWQAFLINRMIRARSHSDGKTRALVIPSTLHGIVIHCRNNIMKSEDTNIAA